MRGNREAGEALLCEQVSSGLRALHLGRVGGMLAIVWNGEEDQEEGRG